MTQSLHDCEAVAIDPAGADIPAEAARLRALGDLVPVELPGGIRAWAPTRHHILKSFLTDPNVSKDPRRHWETWRSGALHENPEAHWIYNWVGVENMLTAYGDDHSRLRKLIAPAFTARRTEALRPAVETITTDLLDALRTTPPGERVDLRAHYALPLPMRVICDLFGLVAGEGAQVAAFVEVMMDTTTAPEIAGKMLAGARETLTQLIDRKRAEPGEDLTSALIAAHDGQDRLSETELVDTLILLLAAGHETTVNLIGNAVVALLRNPDQLAALRAGDVPWTNAVEETLRWAPSIANLPLRFAVSDISVGSVTIRAGEAILTTFGAAGWDPEFHGADAHRFDVRRTPSEHLAFGHGAHRCVGAPLARAEAIIALPALFDAFPAMRLAEEEFEPVPSFVAHGHRTLTVRLRP
ncbi:cytochrome P450 family protein [Streptomyces bathyalis]|uniref:cytochrome P450 family protein n=1 Tax=Streptomyces bathyalis TaxID=2710756 RepID=UPI001FE6059A|nr:cytochrome P450 [Streptomyces bathyalis]